MKRKKCGALAQHYVSLFPHQSDKIEFGPLDSADSLRGPAYGLRAWASEREAAGASFVGAMNGRRFVRHPASVAKVRKFTRERISRSFVPE